MSKSVLEEYVADRDNMRAFQQERAVYEVTELIEGALEESGIGRAGLATRLGCSKGWVTQLLDGEGNKTVRTVADTLAVLGRELRFSAPEIQIVPQIRIAEGTGRWVFREDGDEPQEAWMAQRLPAAYKATG